MSKPVVAIVGRPNVGKSSLFNRIIRRRVAVVDDMPGVTRDRLYASVEFEGTTFQMVDTGGLIPNPDEPLIEQVGAQVELAVRDASLVWFVVDLIDGLVADDYAVAEMLRETGKPVLVVANKADHRQIELNLGEVYSLGFDDVYPVSAIHKRGIHDLLAATVERLPSESEPSPEPEDRPIRIAVIGRPNAGKSSIINALVGEYRVIVDDKPGTTRDAIDVELEHEGVRYVLVDTAGMRRRARIEKGGVEQHSVLRATRSVERSDIAWLVLDVTREIAHQDKTLANFIARHGKLGILVANKWDLVQKDKDTFAEYTAMIQDAFRAYDYLPIVFTSAVRGQRIENLLRLSRQLYTVASTRVATPILNDFLRDAVMELPPPVVGRRRPSLKYITQTGILPPTFVIFTTRPKAIPDSYRRYLVNRIRETFDFEGVPIELIFRDAHGERESDRHEEGAKDDA